MIPDRSPYEMLLEAPLYEPFCIGWEEGGEPTLWCEKENGEDGLWFHVTNGAWTGRMAPDGEIYIPRAPKGAEHPGKGYIVPYIPLEGDLYKPSSLKDLPSDDDEIPF